MSKKKKTTKKTTKTSKKKTTKKSKADDHSKVIPGQSVGDDISSVLRKDKVVKLVLKSFKKNDSFDVDFDAMHLELQDMTKKSKALRADKLSLDDKEALLVVGKERLRTQAYRDRATEICNEMRSLWAKANEVWMVAGAYIRQSEHLEKMYASSIDSILYATLREVGSFVDKADTLIEESRAVIFNLDARTQTIDDWVTLQKQYVFISGSSMGSQTRITDGEATQTKKRRKKNRSSRGFSSRR